MTPARIARTSPLLLPAFVLAMAAPTSLRPRLDRVALLETTAVTSANVSVGDLDGDGDLDVVLAKGRHWPLANVVLLNDGNGEFGERYDVSDEADRTYTAALADLDGDADLDLVVGNDAPGPKRIHFNDGKGRFTPGGSFGEPSWTTRNVAVADVNGDGRPDIVVANRGGARRGASISDPTPIGERGDIFYSIAVADLNGDGLDDIVIGNRDTRSAALVNAGGLRFDTVRFGESEGAVYGLAIGDMNGDGTQDVLAARSGAPNALYSNELVGASEPGVRYR